MPNTFEAKLEDYLVTEGGKPVDPTTVFENLKQIGEGAFATVSTASNVKTKEKVAIKKIPLNPKKHPTPGDRNFYFK